MQIKTIMRYHHISFRRAIIKKQEMTSVGEDVKKRESQYTVGRNINWHSHYGKECGGAFKKLNIESPYDPTIPLLAVQPRQNKNTNLKRCKFNITLFTIAKIWKQPTRP